MIFLASLVTSNLSNVAPSKISYFVLTLSLCKIILTSYEELRGLSFVKMLSFLEAVRILFLEVFKMWLKIG